VFTTSQTNENDQAMFVRVKEESMQLTKPQLDVWTKTSASDSVHL